MGTVKALLPDRTVKIYNTRRNITALTIAKIHDILVEAGVHRDMDVANPLKDYSEDMPKCVNIKYWPVDLPSPPKSEKELENAIVDSLLRYGVNVKQQTQCGLGRSDIETNEEVCEVKAIANRAEIYEAIGQLTIYSFWAGQREGHAGKKKKVLFLYDDADDNVDGITTIILAAQESRIDVYLVPANGFDKDNQELMRGLNSLEEFRIKSQVDDMQTEIEVNLMIEAARAKLIEANRLLSEYQTKKQSPANPEK